MTRIKRLAKEGSWIIFGQISSAIASLVLVRILTEHLDPSQYGQLALALTLGTLVCQIAFSGSMPGIMRYYTIAAEKGQASEYLLATRHMMAYGTFIALGLSGLLLFSLPLFGKSDMLMLTCMTIIFSLLSNYNATQSMIQNAARQRLTVALHGSMDSWVRVLIALAFLTLWGNSATMVVVAYIVSLLLVLMSQAIFIQRLIPGKVTRTAKSRRWADKIWEYSKPFVYFNTFTWVQASSDRWALDVFGTPQDVGLYTVLLQLGFTPIAIFIGLISTLIAPILFQRSGDTVDPSRNIEAHKLAWQITAIILLCTLIACLFASLLHGWIFRLLVAEQYYPISYLLPWMVLASGFFSAGQMLSLKLMSELKTKAMVLPKIATSLLGALLSFSGAYLAGSKGVVYGAITFSILQLLWLAWLSRHPISIHTKVVST